MCVNCCKLHPRQMVQSEIRQLAPLNLMARGVPVSLSLFTLLLFSSTVDCFPQGAPPEACLTLSPRHMNTSASLESSPFYFTASSGKFGGSFGFAKSAGIKVELGGAPFKGFFIVAVNPANGQRIGSWTKTRGTEILPCSAITHTNGKVKRYASLLWIPPLHEDGFVTFIGSVVQSFDKYYTHLVATSPATRAEGVFFNETHLVNIVTVKPETLNLERNFIQVQ